MVCFLTLSFIEHFTSSSENSLYSEKKALRSPLLLREQRALKVGVSFSFIYFQKRTIETVKSQYLCQAQTFSANWQDVDLFGGAS